MTTIDDLKEAIVWVEKEAHYNELFTPTNWRFERPAKAFRIAAACMWEKLERLEKGEQA